MNDQRGSSTSKSLTGVAGMAALACVVSLVAGCGSSSSKAGPTPSSTGSSSPSSSAPSSTPATSASASPSSSASPISGPTDCQSLHLALQTGQTQGAAGSQITTYILRNAGSTSCSMFGFPGVSFLDSSGKQLGQAATRTGTAPARFTIPPGQVASFRVQVAVAGCNGNAPQSATIRVFPPNQTGALSAPATLTICTTPTVTAVQSGIVSQ